MRFLSPNFLCILLALCVSGCAVLQSPLPRDTYELTAPTEFDARKSTRRDILVRLPDSLSSLDSDRMIIRINGGITYYSGAQWSDRVPRMVQAKLVEAFENSGYFGGVGIPGDSLTFDYHLITVLRRFEISDGYVFIEVSAKLFDRRGGEIIVSDIFSISNRAGSGIGSRSYVEAFDVAFGELSRMLATWIRDNV